VRRAAQVFIATPVDECYRRVVSRARRGETAVARSYIAKVAMLYAQSPASQHWRVETAPPAIVAAAILAKLGLPGRCGRTRSLSV
jgi:hypothetical protein